MRFSEAEYRAYEARQRVQDVPGHKDPPPLEKSIHGQILNECARRQWYAVHSRMDQPSTTGVGTPDFIVFTPGRVIIIEVKRPGSKLRPSQQAAQVWLKKLGYPFYTVHNLQEFLALCPENPKP